MSNKSIGIRKEWSLKNKLEGDGYLVMRSSASKTGIDILAGKAAEGGHELLAFQVQTSEYIYPEKVADLEKYARAFGARPFVALTRNRKWHFIKPDDLEKNGKMWKARISESENPGKEKVSELKNDFSAAAAIGDNNEKPSCE